MRKLYLVLISILFLTFLVSNGFSIGESIVAKYVAEEIPLDPASNIWNNAEKVTIPLTKQMIALPFGGGSISEVEVRAVHNGKVIGFLVEYADSSKNEETSLEEFRDAVALQFPVNKGRLPSPFMGDAGNPVNIWQFRADLQADLNGKRYFEIHYPSYSDNVGDVQGFYKDIDREFEEIGERLQSNSPVVDLIAKGFGTLTKQREQNVRGKGVYANGKWHVVFLRELKTDDPEDVQFSVGEKKAVNFAVWNGGENEVGARKSVSLVWHDLIIEPPGGIKEAPPIVAEKPNYLPWIGGMIIGFLVTLGIATLALVRRRR